MGRRKSGQITDWPRDKGPMSLGSKREFTVGKGTTDTRMHKTGVPCGPAVTQTPCPTHNVRHQRNRKMKLVDCHTAEYYTAVGITEAVLCLCTWTSQERNIRILEMVERVQGDISAKRRTCWHQSWSWRPGFELPLRQQKGVDRTGPTGKRDLGIIKFYFFMFLIFN